jgi:heme-degrading monooxygenase HmoA
MTKEKGGKGVFARVSTFRIPPGQVDQAIDYIREQVLPGAQGMEGFEGPYLLLDRTSGKALMVGLWESEEAMRASEELLALQHTGNAQSIGARGLNVGKYEVVLSPQDGTDQEYFMYLEQTPTALG